MLRSSERTLVSSSTKSIGLRFQSLHRGLSFAQPSQELVQGPVEVVEGVHRGMKQFSSIDDTKKDLIDIGIRRRRLFETTESTSTSNATAKSRKNAASFYHRNSINSIANFEITSSLITSSRSFSIIVREFIKLLHSRL